MKWQQLAQDTQLDILLSEEIWSNHSARISQWEADTHALVAALAQRGVEWDKNNLPDSYINAYIKTVILNMQKHQDVKSILAALLSQSQSVNCQYT